MKLACKKEISKMKVMEGVKKEALYQFLVGKQLSCIFFTFCGFCAVQWMAPSGYQLGKLKHLPLFPSLPYPTSS